MGTRGFNKISIKLLNRTYLEYLDHHILVSFLYYQDSELEYIQNLHCLGDKKKGFKVRINQYISDYNTGDSTCKFPRHVYKCVIKNNCLEEPFFSLNITLRLNKSDRLETISKHFHLKGYYTMNNPGRN